MPAPRRHARPSAHPRDGERRAMLSKVHIARKELAMTEDAYRDVLARITGADSAKDLTSGQLHAVLGEFKRLGWAAPAPKSRAHSPQARLVYALWKEMGEEGILSDRSQEALRAFCRRQSGVDAPEFLRADQANRVVEGLKGWRRRVLAERAAATAQAVVA